MAVKAVSNKEHPLAGVVLCFTSILPEQRTELATIASQMGATHKFDLTSDVTHLIVGETNTPKYKFVARERSDVIVLKPEWIEAVRQSWMQGDDTDIRALEELHRLPTFAGLSICITGFEDMAFRNYIQNTATANGAEFRKDLTKSVTHLIARSPEGQKYKFATQWNIKIVTMKWFTDSLERGMTLEETLYDLHLPEDQQGVGAWNRSLPPVKEKPVENTSSANPRPRKLRRIASAKLGDQNEGIWGDIVGGGFDNPDFRRSTGSQPRIDSQPLRRKTSIIQEVKSFASESTFLEPQASRQQSAEPSMNSSDGFLQETFFYIHGFSSKQTNVLRHHLSFNGAQIVGSLNEFSRPDIPKRGHGLYTIVPYKMPRNQIPSTDDLAFECEVVTDMWLERCLDAKSLVPPESHVANTPVPSFPVKGFSGMKVCSTGFSRIGLLHLSKLVNLIGASYNEYLTPSASVLVCNNTGQVKNEKLRHTQEWGVPAVSAEWLWDSIRKEQKQALEPYAIRKTPSQGTKDLEVRAGPRPDQQKSQPQTNGSNHSNTSAQNRHTTPNEIANGTNRSTSPNNHKTTAHDTPPQKEKPVIAQNAPNQPHSNPQSPTKERNPTNSHLSPAKRRISEEFTNSAVQSIDLTISGFLKQAQAASSRSASETGESNRLRRRKPLLGRAPSIRTAEHKGISRASSIDTLNDDGCGSAIDSVNTDGIASLVNSGRFEFAPGDRPVEEDETQSPPMTQLNYEDPDAVAMREKFLHHAGKLVEKKPTADATLVMGQVKELENPGWGSGRRTRNAHKAVNNLDDDF
ncbi:BRCT domain-containing protein [Aspergillus floccosus]